MKKAILSVILCSGLLLISGCDDEDNQNIDGKVWETKGKITDETGQALSDVEISVTLNNVRYATHSKADGSYTLKTPQSYDYPKFLAGVIYRKDFKPETILWNYANQTLIQITTTANPKLKPLKEQDVIFFKGLDIIHLGDDNFAGSANSQLQVPSQGKYWIDTFDYTAALKAKYSSICIQFNGRGIQSAGRDNTVSLSNNGQMGTYIVQDLQSTALDGSFTSLQNCFSLSSFPENSKVMLQINSQANSSGDYDDFEIINITGVLGM